MYGLLLENLSEYVKTVYGEEKWEDIRRQAGVDAPAFSVHQVYSENLLNKLAKKAQQVLGVSEREFMEQMGVYFIGFVSQYGYDRVLSVLGRHMRDFLNGLDNLHEYLKFSYPRMRAPSFICENETKQGLTLHYRSKRRGFVYYTMGQIREVARHFYHKEMHIELVREEILFDTVHVTFQLTFDNRAFTLASLAMTREEKHLPISAHVLFEIFPFCIVFGSDMVVRNIGNSLMVILPELLGNKITAWFDLVRPLIAFKFQTILNRTNNIFELVTVEPVPERADVYKNNELVLYDDGTEPEKSLRLKGQMVYMDNWRMMMFLGTPVMPDLTSLINTGLYINDLSMHDFSRDLMLAGTQQSVELKLALDQEQQKSKKLEESMRKLDEEMKRTDELLYQMIPKQVADRLRRGENPIDTCEMFECVSILFSDVVTFTEICSRITPMEVVSMLNAMYSIFDTLTERNLVYKVETIGDAYMVVAGAPEKDPNHAEKVCDMALDMVDAITDLKDPSTGQHLGIRVGVHSGTVVAGIVGLKMPRYCLFGDSVNTASRMESTSATMKIHVSESTKEFLGPNYKLTERGEIEVKGKGTMKTYWLEERENRQPLQLSGMHLNPMLATTFGGHKTKSTASKQQSSTIIRTKPKLHDTSTKLRLKECISLNTICAKKDQLKLSGTELKERTGSASTVVENATGGGLLKTSGINIEERVRMYSPITFKDVARRSIANSPVRHIYGRRTSTQCYERGRETRSNSMGHVCYPRNQEHFTMGLALDSDEFLEDLQTTHVNLNCLPCGGSWKLLPETTQTLDADHSRLLTGKPTKFMTINKAPVEEDAEFSPNKEEVVSSISKIGNVNKNVSFEGSVNGSNHRKRTSTFYKKTIPLPALALPLKSVAKITKKPSSINFKESSDKVTQVIQEVSERSGKDAEEASGEATSVSNSTENANSDLRHEDISTATTALKETETPAKAEQVKEDPNISGAVSLIGSNSDSNICSYGHSHLDSEKQSIEVLPPSLGQQSLGGNQKLSTSQSFSYGVRRPAITPTLVNTPIQHSSCCANTNHNGRHSHRAHSNACQIL